MAHAASETTVLLLSFKQCKSSIAQGEQPQLGFVKSPLLFPCIVLQNHFGAASFKFRAVFVTASIFQYVGFDHMTFIRAFWPDAQSCRISM